MAKRTIFNAGGVCSARVCSLGLFPMLWRVITAAESCHLVPNGSRHHLIRWVKTASLSYCKKVVRKTRRDKTETEAASVSDLIRSNEAVGTDNTRCSTSAVSSPSQLPLLAAISNAWHYVSLSLLVQGWEDCLARRHIQIVDNVQHARGVGYHTTVEVDA